MEHKVAVKLCRHLINNQTIEKEYEDVYTYGLELLISFIVSTSVILAIGLAVNRIAETLIYFLVFISLRQFSGGYHADTYLRCKIVTILTYALIIVLSEVTSLSIPHYILLFLLAMILLLQGPVENPNKPLTSHQHNRNKVISIVIFLLLFSISLSMLLMQFKMHSVFYYSLLSVLLLMIVAKYYSYKEKRR